MSKETLYQTLLFLPGMTNEVHYDLLGQGCGDDLALALRNAPAINAYRSVELYKVRRANRYIKNHPVWAHLPSNLLGFFKREDVRNTFFTSDDLKNDKALLSFIRTLSKTQVCSLDLLYSYILKPSLLFSVKIVIAEEYLPSVTRYIRKFNNLLRMAGVVVRLEDNNLSISFANLSTVGNHVHIFKLWADNPEASKRLFQPLIRCLHGLPEHTQ